MEFGAAKPSVAELGIRAKIRVIRVEELTLFSNMLLALLFSSLSLVDSVNLNITNLGAKQ